MRSTTTFLVFGAIIVAVVLIAAFTKFSNSSNPATQAASAFLTAAANSDLPTMRAVTDPKLMSITSAGTRFVGVKCNETTIPQSGAFGHLASLVWSNSEIAPLTIDPIKDPVITGDASSELAVVYLTNGGLIYLHRRNGGDWRVFHLAKPSEKKK